MINDQLFEALEAVADESSFGRFVDLLVADRQSADSLALTVDGYSGRVGQPDHRRFPGGSLGMDQSLGFR